MTRLEFLTKMENCLSKQLTKSEMSTIMRNLIDYFNAVSYTHLTLTSGEIFVSRIKRAFCMNIHTNADRRRQQWQ